MDLVSSIGGALAAARVVGQAGTELISARELAQQPGINTQLNAWTPDDGFVDGFTDSWIQLVTVAKASMIDAVSNGVAGTPGSIKTVNESDVCESAIAWMPVQGLGQAFLLQDTFRMGHGFDGSGAFAFTPPELSYQQPLVTVIGMTNLVEAVNAITDQDATFSINQGAAAFSIKAKVSAP